ncbi:hypothetical protein Ocepr_2301 (plasmid) [Oceanithermus profundus DSM 14977]|uniref:Schlafen AlbA-2 domain-containing protein n=1 Tax=Oceanithermus profundus (strain DSM 14977 / NBRC 100410 / VKM B-2274 / 506) TaxID=670487 RepID=E4UAW4_OCEP5|nr:ATP-binding protein [Oceanithermus profundus]ADR37749.1 hypothetical protein Ocepr_2301 [Oceanithermus profundus DSM 14977]
MEKIFGSMPPTEKDLERLVTDRVRAGHHLVYVPRPSDEDEEAPQGEEAGRDEGESQVEALVHAAAALANAHGGVVVQGIEATGDLPVRLVGFDGAPSFHVAMLLRDALEEHADPPIDNRVVTVDLDDGRYAIVVEIPPSLDAPHQVNGVYPQRSGRETVVMTAAEIDRVRAHRRTVLEGFRARARELADAAQHGRNVPVKETDGVGLYLYVASVPLAVSGREVEIGPAGDGLPAMHLLLGPPEARVGLRPTHFGALGTRPDAKDGSVEELVYLTHRGEMLLGLPDARAFEVSGKRFCLSTDELLEAVPEALTPNLASLVSMGFEPPFYVALVGAGESTDVRFSRGPSCGYPIAPGELLVEARLPLTPMRTLDLSPEDGMTQEDYFYERLAHPIRPFLDRIRQAVG